MNNSVLGGKNGKKHKDQEIGDDIQDEVDYGDNDSLDLEKENEDHNNVKVSEVTSSKKRKRKRESEPKGSPTEKICKRKKNNTKSKKGNLIFVIIFSAVPIKYIAAVFLKYCISTFCGVFCH